MGGSGRVNPMERRHDATVVLGMTPTVDDIIPASPHIYDAATNSKGFGIQGHAGCLSPTLLLMIEILPDPIYTILPKSNSFGI